MSADPVPDLLVLGAGPAGVSAALWAESFGLSAVVLEQRDGPGGQLLHVHFEPLNFAGGVAGDGREIATRLGHQLERSSARVHYGVGVYGIDPAVPSVRDAAGARWSARAALIATGVRRRVLEVPGEHELEGHGVSFSATQDRERFAGDDVAVVGGGDAAFENALLLAEVGCHVTLLVRARPRARAEFRERVAGEPRIEVLENTRVLAVNGEERVTGLRLASERGDFELPVSAVVIKIGVVPNSEWCAGRLDRDAEGYVLVDEHFGTSQPRVWAIGDVTRPPVASVAVALGQATLAVAAIHTVLREP